MIKDIEEESKTKFSIKVEFSFSFKGRCICVIKPLANQAEEWYSFHKQWKVAPVDCFVW